MDYVCKCTVHFCAGTEISSAFFPAARISMLLSTFVYLRTKLLSALGILLRTCVYLMLRNFIVTVAIRVCMANSAPSV